MLDGSSVVLVSVTNSAVGCTLETDPSSKTSSSDSGIGGGNVGGGCTWFPLGKFNPTQTPSTHYITNKDCINL